MTEKRFKETISTGIVTDTITGKEYNCEMRIDDKLLELLNELSDECEFLKIDNEALEHGAIKYAERYHQALKENEQLKQLLNYADDLIQSHLSEHYIRQWINFKTGHKEYNDFWEEKLKNIRN